MTDPKNPCSLLPALRDVMEFHAMAIAGGATDLHDRGEHLPAMVRRLTRHRLLREEYIETEDALIDGDLIEYVDGLADMIYIILGTASIQIGAERFARVWDEVHRSNMAKGVDGKIVMRDDGKILKPEGWTPPDIAGALEGK